MAADGSDEITVVIVDDHIVFSAALARLFDDEPDILVMGAAATVAGGWALVEEHGPTVVLLDYELPDGDGVRLTAHIKSTHPDTQIVMLTGSADERIMVRAIKAGCSRFLTKDRAASEAADAVRSVARGETRIPPAVLSHLLPLHHRTTHVLGDDLTEREREVLELLAAGMSNRAIADRTFLSVNTIRNYVSSILTKLGCHSKLEAVAVAVRAGIIDYP